MNKMQLSMSRLLNHYVRFDNMAGYDIEPARLRAYLLDEQHLRNAPERYLFQQVLRSTDASAQI